MTCHFHRRLLCAAGMFLAVSISAGHPAKQQAPAVLPPNASQQAFWPDRETIKGNLYTNPFFGFSIEIPKAWKIFSKEQIDAVMPTVSTQMSKDPGKHSSAAVGHEPTCPATKVACHYRDACGTGSRTYAACRRIAALDGSKDSIQYTTEPQSWMYGGQKLWKSEFAKNGNDGVSYGRQLMLPDQWCVASVMFYGPSKEALDDLQSILQTIKFFPPTKTK